MHLLCIGVSHQTARVDLRERLAMNDDQAADLLRQIRQQYPQAEAAVLSTCNRTEIYLARPLHGHPRYEEIVQLLAQTRGVQDAQLQPVIYHHDGTAAIEHLFRVTCGIESMVLGESQIVGQVKHAYELAQSSGSVGRSLHRMFQTALSVSKAARTTTRIGEGQLSIGSVAVAFARHLFQRFDNKTILMLGAGEMGELALRHFIEERPARLLICNRSTSRAEDLANRHQGQVVAYDQLDDHLIAADLVISSTGAEHAIVSAQRYQTIARQRRHRPLFIIDLAIPRDFDPEINADDDVFLYNIDDLQQAVAEHHDQRSEQVESCRQLIDEAVRSCYTQIQSVDFAELIRVLREQMHAIGDQENQRTLSRLIASDPDAAEEILAEHTHRLVNKILHRPLRELGRLDSTQAAMYATALRRLFDLDINEDLNPPESQSNDPRQPSLDRRPASRQEVE